MKNNIKILMLVALGFIACDSNNDDDSTVVEVPVTPGTAVFTNYVALGDSFAAGYSDNGLFIAGQQGAYTNILSQQFAAAGGGTFKTPLTSDNTGGLLFAGNVIAGNRLYFNGAGPVPVAGQPTTEVTNVLQGTFNNMGVPGARSYHLLAPGYGNPAGVPSGKANPYFVHFASSPNTTVLADALVQNATFFSLWIGGNDVLGYALNGGDGVNQLGNLDPSTYASNDITDPNVFASVFNTVAQKMSANGAKGVVANLPYVTTLPYFTTVPYNPLPLTAEFAGMLNAGYAQYNGGLQFAASQGLLTPAEVTKRTIKFAAGQNAVVIVDSYLTNLAAYGIPSYRQATKADLMVLPSRNFIGTQVGDNPTAINGASVPLADKWVLTNDEVSEVKTATEAYNKTIEAAAATYNLAFVDAKKTMVQLSTGGISFGNYQMTAAYVTGGAFSLDGIHPSARGYALIANVFIASINAKYNATLQPVDLAKYQIQYQKTLPQ